MKGTKLPDRYRPCISVQAPTISRIAYYSGSDLFKLQEVSWTPVCRVKHAINAPNSLAGFEPAPVIILFCHLNYREFACYLTFDCSLSSRSDFSNLRASSTAVRLFHRTFTVNTARAASGTRTHDNQLGKLVFYHLNYCRLKLTRNRVCGFVAECFLYLPSALL